ncbi:MAG: competence protein TfoX [Firmicutes bacterium]|nr:competence protein TfoX [Bacillota bacterium]
MTSSKEYLHKWLERLIAAELVSKPMMGEYLLYYRGKYTAAVCDDRLLPDAPLESPYEGAKPMLCVADDTPVELVLQLLEAAWAELPAPKSKKR